MKSFRSETLEPLLSIALLIMFFLLFVGYCYCKGYFSTQEASNTIQAVLVGILVILTAYYAYATQKQANTTETQSEGVFWQKIIEYSLLPWMKCLRENSLRFRDLWFNFFVYDDSFRVELKSLIPRTDERCESYFIKKHDRVARKMETYKEEVRDLEEKLIDFVREFWTEELFDSLRAFLRSKDGGKNWEVPEVLELTTKKFLMKENRFRELRLADEFNREIWGPLLKEALEAFSPSTEETEAICTRSSELSHESTELLDVLSTIYFGLCEKYSLLYQSLTI